MFNRPFDNRSWCLPLNVFDQHLILALYALYPDWQGLCYFVWIKTKNLQSYTAITKVKGECAHEQQLARLPLNKHTINWQKKDKVCLQSVFQYLPRYWQTARCLSCSSHNVTKWVVCNIFKQHPTIKPLQSLESIQKGAPRFMKIPIWLFKWVYDFHK